MLNNAGFFRKESKGYLLILGYLGIFLMLVGALCLIPLVIIPFDYDNSFKYLPHFIITGLTSIAIGAIPYFLFVFKRKLVSLRRYQDAILIVSIWIVTILVNAIPLATSGLPNMNYATSIFEMVSGYTTTGVTVMGNVDIIPKIFLLQRVIIQAFGGIGLILVITTAFNGRIGMKLFKAEGHSETILPNLAKTARVIVLIYLAFITLGTIAFLLAGMNFFEAFSFAVSCISTGGFSVVQGNIHSYNSLTIEIICMVLMMIGAISFYFHLSFATGKFKKLFDTQTIVFLSICVFLPLLISLLLVPASLEASLTTTLDVNIKNYGDALRYTSFQVISAATTTGLISVKTLSGLPEGMLSIMCILIIIGGCSGSTAGGLKVSRLIIVCKGIFFNLKEQLGSKRIVDTHYVKRYGVDEEITKDSIVSSISYILLYFGVIAVGMLSLAILNPSHNFGDSFFEAASLTGGVGFGLVIEPLANYANLWISMILMLLGRLEILIIFVAFYCVGRDISGSVRALRIRKTRGESADNSN